MKQIENLTKEDLIKILANISCQIQTKHDWVGFGFAPNDALVVETVGNLCQKYCIKNDDWHLPEIETHE